MTSAMPRTALSSEPAESRAPAPHADAIGAVPTASAAPRTAILELRGLTKDFTHNWTMRRFRALDGLTLAVERGEILGLMGPNGAGKTTTFKCLLGLLRPSAGAVLFDGRPLGVAERAAIGFLPEQPYFYDYLTVTEMLALLRPALRPVRPRRARPRRRGHRAGAARAQAARRAAFAVEGDPAARRRRAGDPQPARSC